MDARHPENPLPRSLTIIVPTLNEESGVAQTLGSLPRDRLSRMGVRSSVLVVDGHSTDHTRSLAESMGARVLVQHGTGKGNAIREVVRRLESDYFVVIDGDGSYHSDAIPAVVDRLLQGYDCASGSRFAGSIDEQAMTRLNMLGNRFLTGLANLLFGPARTTDLCTGLWAFRSDAFRRLDLSASGFEIEADMFTEAARLGLEYAEIPIRYSRRLGKSKLRWYTGINIARKMIRARILKGR